MPNECWLNGSFLPEADANVSVFDRGFIFGDGVYEVTSILDGGLIDVEWHLERLDRSLEAIGLACPMSHREWIAVIEQLASRSAISNGFVYLQVTRGPADRDFPFPEHPRPTMFAFARPKDFRNDPLQRGAVLHVVPDLRWARRDIKSVSLLAQVLAKQAARAAGANEALMHEDGVVTEGAASTAWIVSGGKLVTRSLSHSVLAGVTRLAVLEIARSMNLDVVSRTFTLDEAFAADEVFITNATGFVTPVVRIDDRNIGDGRPGEITMAIRAQYIRRAEESAARRKAT